MRLLKYILIFIIAAACIFRLWQERPSYETISGRTMGTYYGIKIKNSPAAADLAAEIEKTLTEVNAEMSVFDPDSELSKINAAPAGQWLELSEPMRKVMKKAHEIYRLSGGAFDPTVGRLIDLWGFGVKKGKKRPDDKEIRALLATSGFDKIRFDKDWQKLITILIPKRLAKISVVRRPSIKLKKDNSEVTLNLSAIAKGYGVDRVAEKLEELGIRDYVVEIGGEVRAAGRKSEDVDGWNVGIVKPEGHYTENAYVLTVKNRAVATSGDYRNFYYDGGRKFSHTISPQTGYPVENGLASVTVFHDDCMTADALATALTAMGEKEALAFAEENGLAVILFVRDGSGIVPQFSSEAKKMTGEK